MGYIYKIYNDNNDKIYIGQTKNDLKIRWNQHIHNSQYEDSILYRAMKKYGYNTFHMEKLEECDDNLLNDREKYWINYFHSYGKGYNATPGGTSIYSGNMNKLVDIGLIKQLWDEGKSIMDIKRITGYSKTTIQEHLNDYENYSIKESIQRGNEISHLDRGIKVIQLDLMGNKIAEFSSILEAAKKTNTQTANIRKCLKGERKKAGGFKWETTDPQFILNKQKTKIYQYDLNNNLIAIFNNKSEAARITGADSSGISKVCKGKAKTCGGYFWKEILEEENP